jgi:hypothetical protein
VLQDRDLYSPVAPEFNCTAFNSKLQNLQLTLTNIKSNLNKNERNEEDYTTGDFK